MIAPRASKTTVYVMIGHALLLACGILALIGYSAAVAQPPTNPAIGPNGADVNTKDDAPEKATCEGAEIVAHIGSETILAADVLFEADKLMERFLEQNKGEPISPERLAQAKTDCMKQSLKSLVETKLLFAEAMRSVPSEAVLKIEKTFNQQFDKMYLGKIMEREGVSSRTEIEAKFRDQGTTLEAVRRHAFESAFSTRWLEDTVALAMRSRMKRE